MGLLDFIEKHKGQRPTAEQQSQQQKPDLSQNVNTKAAPDNSVAKPTDYVRPHQQEQFAEAQALYNKGSQPEPSAPTPTPTLSDGATSPEPQRQKMANQDKAATDLSPTSMQAGSRAKDVDGPSAPSRTPTKSQQQTVARPSPSWER